MIYAVRYNHTGTIFSENMTSAKTAVREEAARVQGNADAASAVVFVLADDGIYAYLRQDEADADDTGATAFAVISSGDH